MASKKSKILAMALCASVMTGIYASPVMAAGQISGINVTGVIGAGLDAQDSVFINGVELEILPDGTNGKVTAAGGNFTQLTVTNGMEITGVGLTVNGETTLKNTKVDGTLTATGLASLNGGLKVNGDRLFANKGLTVTGGDTVIDGGRLFADKGLTVSADGIQIVEGDLDLTDGNVDVGGTLNVNGDTTLKNTTVNGTLTAGATDVDSLTVNTDKFVVDADGNTTVGGTLTAGATTVDSLKSNGNAEVGGTLEVTGDTTLAGLTAGARV